MYRIKEKKILAENTVLLRITAPEIAKKARAGNFVMLRIDEKGERIPLTIVDYDKDTITLIFLVVGRTTDDLLKLNEGDSILDVVGPLGNAIDVEKYGKVVFVGGGLGIAAIYPQLKTLKKLNKIISIIGARTDKHLFLVDEIKENSNETIICTDDGSLGRKGFVTEALKDLIENEKIDRVVAIGPPVMMKAVSDVTRNKKIKTIASINTIMVDGIGMCGSCRVKVKDEIKFACVDGPEFDAHDIDWDEFLKRNSRYKEEEHECMLSKK
ncbi:MAG: sulfide/dihydroorotate dehydrogenase-like FAD/NAD-binding protein [Candidatus Nanoarchaeia archaeon]|nr:sulfide/dihydroorotate dehydrogenase-like FAD/NAD-binding protein [Candidatus Nanoarchaeia archaeon]